MIPSGLFIVCAHARSEVYDNSYRLLSHLESIVQGSPLCCWSSNFPSDGDSKCVQEAMRLLREAFKVSCVHVWRW